MKFHQMNGKFCWIQKMFLKVIPVLLKDLLKKNPDLSALKSLMSILTPIIILISSNSNQNNGALH